MEEWSDIPKKIAIKLCDEIREKNKNKRFSFLGYQCLGCYKFSKGIYEKMCLNNIPGFKE